MAFGSPRFVCFWFCYLEVWRWMMDDGRFILNSVIIYGVQHFFQPKAAGL
jgi:hypothetical protein